MPTLRNTECRFLQGVLIERQLDYLPIAITGLAAGDNYA